MGVPSGPGDEQEIDLEDVAAAIAILDEDIDLEDRVHSAAQEVQTACPIISF